MYRNVIVPLDGSPLAEAALEQAAGLASQCGGQVLLLSVVDLPEQEAARQQDLAKLADGLGPVPAEQMVVVDPDPAAAIARAAAEQGDGLVCMSTHGRGGLARALLGSVAEAVLRRMTEPVLLVGPNSGRAASPLLAGRLMVCLDGSPHAEAILPVAMAWAREFALEPYLVEVLDPDTEGRLRAADVLGGDVREDAYLARVAGKLRTQGVRANWDVLHGARPAAAIIDHATHRGASLIAMSTHGRTGLLRIAIGSVALQVVHDSHCPTLVLRPEGLGSK